MLELKAEPENMEVMGYVRSRTVLKTEFIACVSIKQKNQVIACVSQKLRLFKEVATDVCTLDHSLALCLVLTALLSSAYSAPMNEPIDVPPTMSIGIPASSMALITPTWEHPLHVGKHTVSRGEKTLNQSGSCISELDFPQIRLSRSLNAFIGGEVVKHTNLTGNGDDSALCSRS